MEAFHFGEWLKREIQKQALSQWDFALKHRIKLATLKWWLALPAPNILTYRVAHLARALKMPLEDLEAVLAKAKEANPPKVRDTIAS